MIYYIKTQHPQLPNLKNKTKTIYQNIVEKGSENHTINGEKKWKEKLINLDFTKIWKNTFFSYSKPKEKIYYRKYYTTQLQQIALFTKLAKIKQA